MKRTFIAFKIQPPANALQEINSIRNKLKNVSVKWVPFQNYHLTFTFIGQTNEEQLKALEGLLKQTADQLNPFTVDFKRLGTFGRPGNPKVLWIGGELSDPVGKVKNELDESLRTLGFNLDGKPFRVHLTLGRIKRTNNLELLKNTIERYKEYFFFKEKINDIILYESVNGPDGPLYYPLIKEEISQSV
ncbi:MAG TPA: RNA 2',3'-cyclic phosphodiesterase [Bacteroidales bacterium]|nr:RNA 2',3'-cyclic phosphodiesterase [Bacteroidales bacterium]